MREHAMGIAVLVGLLACDAGDGAGGGGAGGGGGSGPEVAVAAIGPNGGTLRSSDGVVTVVVPAGALDSERELVVRAVEPPVPGIEGRAYELGPDGTRFALPVEVRFAVPSGTASGELRVARLFGGTWAALEATDVAEAQASGFTTRFSYYGLLRDIPGCTCDLSVWEGCCADIDGVSSGDGDSCWCNWWTAGESLDDVYGLFDCYEAATGFDLGGCTACERSCCRAAGGLLASSAFQCFCTEDAGGCMAACEDQVTVCEACGDGTCEPDEVQTCPLDCAACTGSTAISPQTGSVCLTGDLMVPQGASGAGASLFPCGAPGDGRGQEWALELDPDGIRYKVRLVGSDPPACLGSADAPGGQGTLTATFACTADGLVSAAGASEWWEVVDEAGPLARLRHVSSGWCLSFPSSSGSGAYAAPCTADGSTSIAGGATQLLQIGCAGGG